MPKKKKKDKVNKEEERRAKRAERQQKAKWSKKNNKKQHEDEYMKNFKKFQTQLGLIDLKIVDVRGDGNCLFRALADQLEGNESLHREYRQQVVKTMLDHEDNFAPFLFDEDFKVYCNKMSKDGCWGGNLELVAASQCFQTTILVHQLQQPRFQVCGTDTPKRTLHLSYHEGEHYASVRHKEDHGDGPAMCFSLPEAGKAWRSGESRTDSKSHRNDSSSSGSKGSSGSSSSAGGAMGKSTLYAGSEGSPPTGKETMLMETTGCYHLSYVRNLLQLCAGDADQAMEILVSEKAAGLDWEAASLSLAEGPGAGAAGTVGSAGGGGGAGETVAGEGDDGKAGKKQRPPKAKAPCPCGSGRKYRHCCKPGGKQPKKDHLDPVTSKGAGGKRGKKTGPELSNKQRKEMARADKQGKGKGKTKKEQRQKEEAEETDENGYTAQEMEALAQDFGTVNI